MMYSYVEMQRAKRGFRVIAIVLGIVLLIAIALRVWGVGGGQTPEGWAHAIQYSAHARVTTQHLADGSVRTIVDDPSKDTHAVIDRHGNALRIDVTQPASAHQARDNMAFGHVRLTETPEAHGMEHVTLVYVPGSYTIPLGIFFLATLPLGLTIATLLGCALAKENEGHLEIAWTKPISRESYAMSAMLVDVMAIVMTTLASAGIYAAAMLLFFKPIFSTGPDMWPQIGIAFLEPIAWYALLTAFSASLKRGMGMVIGFGWFAGMVIPSIAAALARSPEGLGQAFFTIFRGLSYIDPLAYTLQVNGQTVGSHGLLPALGGAVVAQGLLALGYLTMAVLQWRRVEA